MTIEVSCECAMTYRLPDRFAGKRCRCRECGDSIRVPTLDEESSEDLEEELDSDSVEDDIEDEAPEPPRAVKRPAPRPKPAPKAERTYTSESLQQMAPLTLSEAPRLEPPAARARVKKKRAEIAAKQNARASKQRVGPNAPDSETPCTLR